MGASDVLSGLIARGMPPHIAQAFVVNGMDESGLRTDINEAAPVVPGSRGGYGLMQWTGPRRRALEAFAAERGVAPSDMDAQLDFLMYELQGPEASAWGQISAASDTPTAAAAIVNSFLRPSEEHRKRREANYLGGRYSAPDVGQAPTGNALAVGQPPQPQYPQLDWKRGGLDPETFMVAQQQNALTPIQPQIYRNNLARVMG